MKIRGMDTVKSPVFWAKVAGAAIPLGFLAYVLYINFLPFGFEKTYTINVGSENDTKVSEFYLEPSVNLSERMKGEDGSSYRHLNGYSIALFNPKQSLKNANVDISAEGSNISLITSKMVPNMETAIWDNIWDFTKNIPNTVLNNGAFYFDGKTFLDGKSSVEVASSSKMFENGPFSVYAEWGSFDRDHDFQEIIGHYNWELLQNKDSVQFQIGRMNNASGTTHILKYPITEDFFETPHSALIIYSPADENGQIDFFVDGKLVERRRIGSDRIWADYGSTNLSFGWTPHNYGRSPHFKGYLYKAAFATRDVLPRKNNISFSYSDLSEGAIYIFSDSTTTLKDVRLHVRNP